MTIGIEHRVAVVKSRQTRLRACFGVFSDAESISFIKVLIRSFVFNVKFRNQRHS